jgi:hypothetical protein
VISSIKKSEQSFGIRENLGSLIFETPPKGSIYRSQHFRETSQFFYSKMEVSPTPLKFAIEEEYPIIGSFKKEGQ